MFIEGTSTKDLTCTFAKAPKASLFVSFLHNRTHTKFVLSKGVVKENKGHWAYFVCPTV